MTATLTLQPLLPAHRPSLEALLGACEVFRPAEIEVAMELFDTYLAHPGRDYSLVGVFEEEALLGYACWGPTPCTEGTWDLYWIAVDPSRQGRGTGTRLLREVEAEVVARHARVLLIETSARPEYAPACSFYERGGYREVARVPDFYAPSDDRLIFMKRFPNQSLRSEG